MEQNAEEEGDKPKEPSPPSPRRAARGKSVYFKALCPDALVASIIGKGGETRRAIEEETGARLRISGRDEFYPETLCRVLSASASEVSQIVAVMEQIFTRVVELGNAEQDQRERGKGKRPDETETMLGKEPGEYIFRTAVPVQCTGALIGSKGSRIKALREKTGAKVFVDNETFEGHQLVKLIGTTEAILLVVPSVCESLESEVPEDKLAQWAAVTSFKDGGRGRKGRGKRPRREDRDGGKGQRRERSMGRHHSRSRSRSPGAWEYDNEREHSPYAPPEEFDDVAPIEHMQSMVEEFPHGALGMAHAISCDLPNYRVGGLIGRRGDYIHYVQRETGTQVVFNDVPKGSDVTHRTMTVTGPLLAVYAAHMMMMRRFHEDEARDEAESRPRGRQAEEAHIGKLQSQLADLERQLAEARGGDSRRRGKGRR